MEEWKNGRVVVPVLSTTTPATNTWYHVVGTYDGATAKIYVDGVFENSASHTNTITASAQPLFIGRGYNSGGYLNARLDEPLAFNRVRQRGSYEPV